MDGSVVSRKEVVADPFFASRDEPAGVHAEVGTRVGQELPFTNPVGDEKVACGCNADMPPLCLPR
jgi:hypothetical protein